MPSWRESLCRHYGLCSSPVKLFKRRVNSIHQIVWICEEISKNHMASKRLRPFCAVGHTCFSIAACGGPALLLCGAPIRDRCSFVPTFHALRSKLRPMQPAEQKKLYKRPRRNWPKTLCFCGILVSFPPPAPDLCFSHKFLPRMEKHV